MSAIMFKNFSYSYTKSKKALDRVTLTVPKGAFTAIVGPSGAGKTTLCQAISGVVPHYFGGSIAGEVVVNGMSTMNSSMGELAGAVGTVLEDYESQLVTMTVQEEVAFALESRGMNHKIIKERVTEALTKVGLEGLETREVNALSGGQRQRLAIASVLAAKPGILVLDEPASALDPEGAEEIYALLSALNRDSKITIIVVEHELARVLEHVDQLVLLKNGQISCEGDIDKVLTYMWEQEDTREMVPALWTAKLRLEQAEGIKFGAWRVEEDAVKELFDYLINRDEEDSKSA